MKKFVPLPLLFLLLVSFNGYSQKNTPYLNSIRQYQRSYVNTHEVVTGKDRQYLRFYPADSSYRLNCRFERINDTSGFQMKTSNGSQRQYYKYGKISFSIRDTTLELFVYQSQELMKSSRYRDYLFIPFTDLTTGFESYGGGRYIDVTIADISNGQLLIDFNKAYNPYCAYTTGYRCPVPPRENDLKVAIRSGEKAYAKAHR